MYVYQHIFDPEYVLQINKFHLSRIMEGVRRDEVQLSGYSDQLRVSLRAMSSQISNNQDLVQYIINLQSIM